jgi:hypothetical protein
MEVVIKGTSARIEDVKVGECFAFEVANGVAIGMLIGYRESSNASLFVLTRQSGQAPSLLGPRETKPSVVFKQPLKVVTSALPARLRSSVGNPVAGQLFATSSDQFIGFVDHQGDPSLVSLKTGHIFPNPINEPVAVFDTWQVVIDGTDGLETVFKFKPAAASQAA